MNAAKTWMDCSGFTGAFAAPVDYTTKTVIPLHINILFKDPAEGPLSKASVVRAGFP